MQALEKGDMVTISHKFQKLGYNIIGSVVTAPTGVGSALPYLEIWNKKTQRVYLKNILAITLVANGKEVIIKR